MLQDKARKSQTYFVYFKIYKPMYCGIRLGILPKSGCLLASKSKKAAALVCSSP